MLSSARSLDQEALSWIYRTYHASIYRYLYHHLGDAQTAQDLASEVFRRLLQALRDGAGPSRQLSAWLYRVAHNLIVDELRRRTHRDHQPLDETLAETLSDTGKSPEELAGTAVTNARIRVALHDLTPEQREVIVLKFLQGMSNAEVAEVTGKTVSAVKALQHRGLDTLREQFVAADSATIRTVNGRAEALST
jgi:RNA polymerase sigma-70 factor (ECF subfamily)